MHRIVGRSGDAAMTAWMTGAILALTDSAVAPAVPHVACIEQIVIEGRLAEECNVRITCPLPSLSNRTERMTSIDQDANRREALIRLRAAARALTEASAAAGRSPEARQHLLVELRKSVAVLDEHLLLVDHHVRGPLTVVKGRAQLLRRYELSSPHPDLRLVAGLNEIDHAVERIVANLERLLDTDRLSASDPLPAGDDPSI